MSERSTSVYLSASECRITVNTRMTSQLLPARPSVCSCVRQTARPPPGGSTRPASGATATQTQQQTSRAGSAETKCIFIS